MITSSDTAYPSDTALGQDLLSRKSILYDDYAHLSLDTSCLDVTPIEASSPTIIISDKTYIYDSAHNYSLDPTISITTTATQSDSAITTPLRTYVHYSVPIFI